MAYASRVGRARVSSKNPQALAICDRCGFTYNHVDLAWQFDWGGASLINKRILVCQPCNDTPQNQLRAIVLPADPTPIMNPRTESFAEAETDNITISAPTVTDFWTGIPIPSTTTIVTQDGQNLTTQVIGAPTGLDANAVMPLYNNVKYGTVLPITAIFSNNTSTITVNCLTSHGLSNNDQVAIEGASNPIADGFYSVTVASATVFKYSVVPKVASQSFLTPTTRVITVLAGLPYDYSQIPLTGVMNPEEPYLPYYNWVNNDGNILPWVNNSNTVISWV